MYQKQEPLIFHEKRFSQYNTTSVDPLKFLHVDISFLTPPIMASAPHPWLLCKYYTSTRAVNEGPQGFHSAFKINIIYLLFIETLAKCKMWI